MRLSMRSFSFVVPIVSNLVLLSLFIVGSPATAQFSDPYQRYVTTSVDFQPVRQDAELGKSHPAWVYMPWTYRWGIGFSDEAGRWSREHGYNGAFVDHDDVSANGNPRGRLDWIEKFQLPFYVDHAGGKGLLHLWDGDQVKPHRDELHGVGVRSVPLNAETEAKVRAKMDRNIGAVKDSPMRAAYALDDEPSWGHFVHPTMWQVTDDSNAYPRWLSEVYGDESPTHGGRWQGYNDIRPQLANWSVAEFDASALMDQWSFNDSHWCNLVGRLVEYSNRLDPATPCGLVGGQMPSPFGGYDYAKLMRKVQYIESYNLGSSQSIIRSFNPKHHIPAVTTHFHKSVDDTIWQTWYYLAQGNRGHIGWVDGWFDGKTPKPWHDKVAPSYKEAAEKIGPLMTGADWKHDGVAIYYSHPSIQLGWILDAEAHGKTWVNRNSDERLSSTAHVRKAWENMLRDSGIQFDHLSYVDVIQKGVPSDYRVLILPACLAMSDAEAKAIEKFCSDGGTVIADYMPGLWDQHGRGRRDGGALDKMFNVKHDSAMRAADVFGDRLWSEVDQDENYSWKSYDEFLSQSNSCKRDASGFHVAVRSLAVKQTNSVGQGKAILMNLSPQWYNAHRAAGFDESKSRAIFIRPIFEVGCKPWARIANAGSREHGYEITYWKLPSGRTLLFVISNPEIRGTSLGGGNSTGLKTQSFPIDLVFDREVTNVRDERSGEVLGDGRTFTLQWDQREAVVVSLGRQ